MVKGYYNSRLSDDINRGSRQIHDVTLYLFLMYIIAKWTCNENLSQTSINKNVQTCNI